MEGKLEGFMLTKRKEKKARAVDEKENQKSRFRI